MSIPGFDAAQAAYDARLPEDPPIFRCSISGEMNEDCEGCLDGDHACPMAACKVCTGCAHGGGPCRGEVRCPTTGEVSRCRYAKAAA